VAQVTGNQVVLQWAGVVGKLYDVQHATSLSGSWSPLQTGITGAPLNVYTATVASASGYLRVKVQ